MAKDPIIDPASTSSGRPSNASSGRIKSVSGPSNRSVPSDQGKNSAPAPLNPYK